MQLDLIHSDSTLVPAITGPVHRLRALLSHLVAPGNRSCTSARAWSPFLHCDPSVKFSQPVFMSSTRLPAPAVGTLCLDNPFKASGEQNPPSTASVQYGCTHDCYVGETFLKVVLKWIANMINGIYVKPFRN